MSTDIVHRVDLFLLTDDDYRLVRQRVEKKVAAAREAAHMSGKQPVAQVDSLDILFEDLGGTVELALQGKAGPAGQSRLLGGTAAILRDVSHQ